MRTTTPSELAQVAALFRSARGPPPPPALARDRDHGDLVKCYEMKNMLCSRVLWRVLWRVLGVCCNECCDVCAVRVCCVRVCCVRVCCVCVCDGSCEVTLCEQYGAANNAT